VRTTRVSVAGVKKSPPIQIVSDYYYSYYSHVIRLNTVVWQWIVTRGRMSGGRISGYPSMHSTLCFGTDTRPGAI